MVIRKRTRVVAAVVVVFGLAAAVTHVGHEPSPPSRAPHPIYIAEREEATGKTQVEPDSFAWGSKIVATFQSLRYFNGGAVTLGWATSPDAGAHWRSGTLRLGGYYAASDPVVTFDAVHHVWLIAGIGFRGPYHEVFVSRSPDGLTWTAPVVAAGDLDEDRDKEWLTCDNGTRSPYRGRCYLAYVDVTRWQLGIRTSDDGGRSWSKVLRLQPGVSGATFSGPVPVTRPNGDLVVPYSFFAPIDGEDSVAAVVSHDGGTTFSAPIRIAALAAADTDDSIRAPALPSATVDFAGTVYVSWMDGRFRTNGGQNDIVFSASTDGVHWTGPARLPLSRARSYFSPVIGVDRATSGKKARLAVAYYSRRLSAGCAVFVPGCFDEIDAWLVRSENGGRTWDVPHRLNTQAMQVAWLADTSLGAMLGDYIGVSVVRGRAVPVFALAGPPSAAGQSESIFACRFDLPVRGRTPFDSSCRRLSN